MWSLSVLPGVVFRFKVFLENLNKRWKQPEDGVNKHNGEGIRLEGLG